jgi:heptosyltransferase-2
MAQEPRIVVVKIAALGDVVMASTLVGALRDRWSCAHITWVTGQGLASLVMRFEGVDKVVAVDDHALLRGHPLARAAALVKAWQTIGRGPWMLGLAAHTDRRYGALLWGSRVAEVRYFRNGALPRGPRRGIWIGAEYARLVADDAQPPSTVPRLAVLGGADPSVAAMDTGQPEVLLAPGGARNVLRNDELRRWPLNNWIQLARALREIGVRVTLIGGSTDAAEGDQVERDVPGVVNLIGRTTVEQLLRRIRSVRLLITHDSGPLHLAILAHTPSVALFGPTSPIERIPPGTSTVVATAAAALPCAPCYDGHGYAPCAHNRCLTEVTVEQVLQLALPRLHGPRGQRELGRLAAERPER